MSPLHTEDGTAVTGQIDVEVRLREHHRPAGNGAGPPSADVEEVGIKKKKATQPLTLTLSRKLVTVCEPQLPVPQNKRMKGHISTEED